MKKKISVISLLIILFGLTTACENNILYEKQQAINNSVWQYNDVKTFKFKSFDSIQPVNISLNLRTTTDYPYSNIWLKTTFNYPNGNADTSTVEYFLCEPSGKWLGQVSGTVIENKALLTQGYLVDTGFYSISIQQAMYENSLPEVLDVGLKVERLELKN